MLHLTGGRLAFFLYTLVFCNLALAAFDRPPEEKKLTPLKFEMKDDEFSGEIVVERVLHKCANGPCVIFKKTDRIKKAGNLDAFQKFLDATGTEVVESDSNPWCKNKLGRPWKKGDRGNPSFNCHSFALGDYVGITPSDWIEGVAAKATEDANAMETFLASYFTVVKTIDPSKQKPEDVESDTDVREGDVLVLTARPEKSLQHVHSGRLVKRGQKWQLMAKLGEDFPVVVGPIAAVAAPYNGQFNEVKIYRIKAR